MAKKKLRDLWSQDGGTRAIAQPQHVTVARGWAVTPEVLPAKPQAPRRRKYAVIRPNARAAVATPLGGQSYNPRDDEHQAALARAVAALERKRRKDEAFVRMMSVGKGMTVRGSLTTDKTWNEEVQETPTPTRRTRQPQRQQQPASTATTGKATASKTDTQQEAATTTSKTTATATKKTKKKKKKAAQGNKRDVLKRVRRSLVHRRHPSRDAVADEVDALDGLLAQHTRAQARAAAARARRRAVKAANVQVKHYGRHYHTPLVLDVAPSEKLVGALRQVGRGAIHPALERMKSLEERNLVPARMRHVYNKRKVLKPKGELRVKRETVGVLPRTDFYLPMSFLARVVLGDGVVHPRNASSSTTTTAAANIAHDNDVSANTSNNNSNKSRANGSHAMTSSSSSTAADAAAVSTSTLMLRVQTCTVAQDVRDALRALEQRRDLPYVIGSHEVAALTRLLRAHDDDDGGDTATTTSTLHILANLSDVAHYATDEHDRSNNNGSDDGDAATHSVQEQRRVCDVLLRAMLGEVALLLRYVKMAVDVAASHNDDDNNNNDNKVDHNNRDTTMRVAAATHALRVLQRLHEHDASAVHKQLLASHGLTTLLAVLNVPLDEQTQQQPQQQPPSPHRVGSGSRRHDNRDASSRRTTATAIESTNAMMTTTTTAATTTTRRLRLLLVRETVVLLRAVTAMDADVQTLLAFDNAFDALLNVAATAMGVLDGSDNDDDDSNNNKNNNRSEKDASVDDTTTLLRDIAVEAVTTAQNMLRGNKATHKLFREMSCARHLCPLLTHRVRRAVLAQQQQQQQAQRVVTTSPSTSTSLVTLTCVSMLASLLREADGDAERRAVQHNLLQCDVLPALTSLAMSGDVVDDGTRIEALRTLAALLHRSRRCIDAFVRQSDVYTLQLRSSSSQQQQQPQQQSYAATTRGSMRCWSAPRALLAYLFTSSDATLLGACVHVMLSLLSAEEAQPYVLEVLLRGLDAASTSTTTAAATASKTTATTADECGQALARALYAPPPASTTTAKYYAAHLLDALLSLPYVAASLLTLPWPDDQAAAATAAIAPATAIVPMSFAMQRRLSRERRGAVTLFDVHVQYVLCSAHGGDAGEGVDTAALAAYVRALLTWLTHTRETTTTSTTAAASVACQARWYDELLAHARREDGAVLHVRLWCAAIAACVCLHAPTAATTTTTTTSDGAHTNDDHTFDYSVDGDKMKDTTSATASSPRACDAQRQLVARFVDVLGGPAFFDGVLFDVRARCTQWSQPAPRALTAAAPVLYDVAFVQTLQTIVDDFATLCARLRQRDDAAATPPLPLRQEQQQQPLSSSSHRDATVAEDVTDSVRRDDDDGTRHADDAVASPPPPPPQQADTTTASSTRDDEAQQQQQLVLLRATNAELEDALQQLRRRVDDAEARVRAAEAQATALTQQAQEQQAAHADARDNNDDDDNKEVCELRERVALLEDAMHDKDEERQQLLQSLALMEQQLQRTTTTTQHHNSNSNNSNNNNNASSAATAAAVVTTQSCAVQHDMRARTHDVAVNTDTVAAAAADADEVTLLRDALARARDDCAELLCMVAELVECVRARAPPPSSSAAVDATTTDAPATSVPCLATRLHDDHSDQLAMTPAPHDMNATQHTSSDDASACVYTTGAAAAAAAPQPVVAAAVEDVYDSTSMFDDDDNATPSPPPRLVVASSADNPFADFDDDTFDLNATR